MRPWLALSGSACALSIHLSHMIPVLQYKCQFALASLSLYLPAYITVVSIGAPGGPFVGASSKVLEVGGGSVRCLDYLCRGKKPEVVEVAFTNLINPFS